jgi:hypothetical protein
VNETIPQLEFLPADAHIEGMTTLAPFQSVVSMRLTALSIRIGTTLWMGHARAPAHKKDGNSAGSTSRLHFDATDNVYVLVKGVNHPADFIYASVICAIP